MTQEINKAFHEAAGKQPDYRGSCIRCGHYCSGKHVDCTPPIPIYPNYAADPRLVIEVMREREDWREFSKVIGFWSVGLRPMRQRIFFVRCDLIMDRTGKLRDLALEWLNQQTNKCDHWQNCPDKYNGCMRNLKSLSCKTTQGDK